MRRIATIFLIAVLASSSGCAIRDMLARSLSNHGQNANQQDGEENPWRHLEEDALYGDL